MIRGRAGAAFFIRGCEWPKSARCGSLPAPEQVQVPGPGPGPSKFQGKEGRAGRGRRAPGPSSAGKFSTSWWRGTYRWGELRGTRAGWGTLARVRSLASAQVPRPVEQPPSPRAGGWGKGQCEVVRGRRQQLDELEFLSGRGAGGGSPGRSWQGQPTIGDGWTEGRTVRAPACLCLRLLACLRVPRLVGD